MIQFNEPTVVINGHTLTQAQAMTVRVALGIFAMSLMDENTMGKDHTARTMTEGYSRCIGEIHKIMRE